MHITVQNSLIQGQQCRPLSLDNPVWYGIVFVLLLGLTGCGKGGVGRFELSGKITYGGKAVPQGYLRFVPDTKKGNHGPGATATIIDGQYKTLSNLGTVGGPHIVHIVGTDGISYKTPEGNVIPIGRPVFPEYQESIDLPKESATHDFDVPVVTKKG